jgi:hypothetical protein
MARKGTITMNKEKDIEMPKVVSGEDVEPLVIATTAGPAPAGDVVATVYTTSHSGGQLYVAPLPPQSLECGKPFGEPGCPVARVWYGYANITPQQQADAEQLYILGSDYLSNPDFASNYVLVVGHLATVEVRDHKNPGGTITSQQTWFMVNKLYLAPVPFVILGSHSTQFFYATGTTSNAQVVAISRGEQSPRAARITWTGRAITDGSPSSVEDMFVTGQADFTRSPLLVTADQYFLRQTGPHPWPRPQPLPHSAISV